VDAKTAYEVIAFSQKRRKANGEKEVCQKESEKKAGSEEGKTECQEGSVARCD
jgi:hypothetical protein